MTPLQEEWNEIWRQERLREDAMLAFHDEVGDRITRKALADKFDLKPTRVTLLIRRRREERKLAQLFAKIEQLETSQQISAKTSTFTAIAERLWMDLGWLAMELEKRRRKDT